MGIEFKNISKSYSGFPVIDQFSLSFNKVGIHCLFGPSGCGKTTLLNLLFDLLPLDSGEIKKAPNEKLAYVFQEERLLPWKTVEENIHFVLHDLLESERLKRTESILKLVRLWEFRRYKPDALSGGMRQRVALARAFAVNASILVMDEPFKGLDMSLKKSLMDAVKTYCLDHRVQVIFITHDIEEALYIATDIYYLQGPPLKIKSHFDLLDSEQFQHHRQYMQDHLLG